MGGKSGGDSSAWYRQQEQERQDAIREGTAAIDRTFDGGIFGKGLVDPAKVKTGRTYYLADGTEYVVPDVAAVTASPTDGMSPAEIARYNESKYGTSVAPLSATDGTASTGAASDLPDLYRKTTTETGFDDAFYDARRQAYLDYAMPQLEDQRSDAQRELTYSLARSGQLAGSTRADQSSELQKLYDIQSQSVADQALDYENQTRTNVEAARSDLIGTLNATGDATGAANSALTRAATLSQPTAYSPLTDLFGSYTSALGTAAAADRARALGWGSTISAGSPSWGGVPTSSVSVKG